MSNQVEKSLSRKEFDVLSALVEGKRLTQRELAEKTGYSVGTVSKIFNGLKEKKLINDNGITTEGVDALEPYRVQRAVIIAAGFGSRLVPITLNTPKPLVRVNGTRMIDTILDAIVAAGIPEIVIVRGYLSEQFDQLTYKYPMIQFVENPTYNEANNISSAMCVRYLLKNSYVLEADLILHTSALIQKYQYSSNFLGIPVERSDDWCFTAKNGIIQSQTVGGELHTREKNSSMELYQQVGISYWSEEDGNRLADHLKQAFEMPGGKEFYWDQIPFKVFPNQYKVEIRPCKASDIVEIDTFRELKAIDKTYDV